MSSAPDGDRSNEQLLHRIDELVLASETMERSMYALAHDLQEPVRAVGTSLEMLRARIQNQIDGESAYLFDFVMSSLDRMKRMIHDMLELSKVGHDSVLPNQDVDAHSVAALALQDLRNIIEESGATVNIDRLPVIRANQEQILRLFENLISNAIKYRGDKPPEIRISASRSNGEWLFSVSDNGIGIPREHHGHIFDLFRRLHSTSTHDGSGLGLATCKKIVQRHNGRIWVESEVGKGSTFYFTLPAHASTRKPMQESGPAQMHHRATSR